MKPTLVVLAAGLGTRYGKLKQFEKIGPSGKTLLDYAIYDVIRAGFKKVVLVIRDELHVPLQQSLLSRLPETVDWRLSFQRVNALPEGFQLPTGRTKPWGTGHAVLAARENIDAPFAVINADDFYGRAALHAVGDFLSQRRRSDLEACLVAYRLDETLSDSGAVSRAICEVDDNGYLVRLGEHPGIYKDSGRIFSRAADGEKTELAPELPVSMNLMGFSPSVFGPLADSFRSFLAGPGLTATSEFYLPQAVTELIAQGRLRVRVLYSGKAWFGLTHAEDRAAVCERIRRLVATGAYPADLWA